VEHVIIVWNLWELCGTCDNHMVRAGIIYNLRKLYGTCDNHVDMGELCETCGNYGENVIII
jgi:hypothetical protein